MLHYLFSGLRGRKLQAYQISQWRRIKLSGMCTDDGLAVSRACTCLFAITEDTIESFPPREAGALVAMLCQTVEVMIVILSRDPPVAEINALCREFKEHIAKRFPDIGICTTSIRELSAFISTILDAAREWNSGFAAAMQILLNRPDNPEELVGLVIHTLTRIMKRINLALFHGLLRKLRIEYSFTEMAAFSRGYRRQDLSYDEDFPRMSGGPIELETDDTESEYKGIGERAELSTFCTFAELVPRHTECCICVTQFDGTEEDIDELPVITKCGHFYHKVCLDTWVNDSAMKTANTCPSCRTELCKPPERLHASLEEDAVLGADDENGSWTTESVAAVPSLPHLRQSSARAITHLSFSGDGYSTDHQVSDTDDSSISSGESDGGVLSRRMSYNSRVERRD